ncbi:MAG: M28 family peptidase [Anaerolineae bacterium]
MKLTRWLWLILLAILAAACLGTATPPPPTAAPTLPPPTESSQTPVPTVAADTPSPLDHLETARSFNPLPAMADIEELTSDRYDGRRAGTEGEPEAARYLARRMAALGLAPIGDNDTYFQSFDIPFRDLASQPVLEILEVDGGSHVFQLRRDFREYVFGPAGPGQAEGEALYAVRGTTADLRDLQVDGNIVVVNSAQGRIDIAAVADRAVLGGAEGLIILTANAESIRVKGSYLDTFGRTIPVFLAGPSVAEALAEAAGLTMADLDSQSFATGVQVRMELALQAQRRARSQNVVGLWPGTDADLDHLVVIIGGHYDHVGRDPDGTLFPGANDNASGVSVAVAVAQHLIEAGFVPQIGLLFVGWGAEEAGLLGSEYYVQNPLFPLEDTLAVINMDVVGQGRGGGVAITETAGPLEQLLSAWGEDLGISATTVPDHGASDQAPFNRRGVPASHLGWEGFDGLIHVAADDFEGIDVMKIQAVGQLVALAVMELATEPALIRELARLPDGQESLLLS